MTPPPDVSAFHHYLSVICALVVISILPYQANAHSDAHIVVPSPGCIQTILDQDSAVVADDCLVELGSFPARNGTRHDGVPYPIADLKSDEYSMVIHYTGGGFPDAALRNWPLSIDLNFGGSGWFSYLLVMVETSTGNIASGFVRQAGDRCNDGYARWNRFSENGNGIYSRSATPFRLVNPLDQTNWRAVENAMLLDNRDEMSQREGMLALADPPLYRSWLPYHELENCASCCVGEIVVMQNIIGTSFEAGRDHTVLGVILNKNAVAQLATSGKVGDRCLAASLDKAADRSEPSGVNDETLFLYRDSWLKIRDELADNCPEFQP